VSGFTTDWLTLREPVDQRSRNTAILDSIERYFQNKDSITAMDLASGRGSMIRALIPRLPLRQVWHAVDDESALLGEAELTGNGTIQLEPRLVELAENLEDVLSVAVDLVTTSAFIDLVSESWLDRLVRGVTARSRPIYIGMSYDGHILCEPDDDLDETVVAAFGRHQRRDKGFGLALGPAAAMAAAEKFRAAGYAVMVERADWHLRQDERELQSTMVAGWFAAVSELGEVDPGALQAWHNRRQAWIAEGRSMMTVGHLDVWATSR
jgi:hypothetical protein